MAWGTPISNIRGPAGPEGPVGPQGPSGEDGAGVAIAGSVATYADLPTTLGADDVGDGYLVEADGLLYVWTGTSFPADGAGVEFRGPAGPTGPTGAQGTPGQRGSKWFTGSGVPSDALPGALSGDMYLDTDTGNVYQMTS